MLEEETNIRYQIRGICYNWKDFVGLGAVHAHDALLISPKECHVLRESLHDDLDSAQADARHVRKSLSFGVPL